MCVETPENGVKAPSESFLVGPSIADEFGDEAGAKRFDRMLTRAFLSIARIGTRIYLRRPLFS